MILSKSFDHREFEQSTTAYRHGITNEMTTRQIENCTALCEAVLQPMRDHIGIPMRISSGFRCTTLNRRVGGSRTSQHIYLKDSAAADIQIIDRISKRHNVTALEQLYKHAISVGLPYDQMILEKKYRGNNVSVWIHVSHKRCHDQRNQHWIKTMGLR